MDNLLRAANVRNDEIAMRLIEHCAQRMLHLLKFFAEPVITTSCSSHEDSGSD